MTEQPKQIIKYIHLKNMGFLQDKGSVPRSYYKEYGGLRLDAVVSDGHNTNEQEDSWEIAIVIFHKTDPIKITVIKDLNLFIELNNLLNKIHESYKASQV